MRKRLEQRLCRVLMLVALTAIALTAARATPTVKLGIDVLQDRNFDVLRGQRVGLVTNQTGVDSRGRSSIDLLRAAPGVKLVALFSPEHGIRGTVKAGAAVKSSRDAVTGLPIYSLHGAQYRPTKAMLSGLQTLVFDMQDVGSRSYTFVATMEECRKACAAYGKKFVVLDRPNPVGAAVEGNIPDSTSRLCPFPIPYRYGLTMGELAQWLNGRASRKASLTVVPLRNYERQPYRETGLTWVASSPNIPRAESPYFYPATGLLGELPALSIGIGTSWPFELAGAPGMDGHTLAGELNGRGLPGWTFEPFVWTPAKGRYAGRECHGVRLKLVDAERAQLTRMNFEIYTAVRRLYPAVHFFGDRRTHATFDAVCGTSKIRQLLQQGQSASAVWSYWNSGAAGFRTRSAKYRIYGR